MAAATEPRPGDPVRRPPSVPGPVAELSDQVVRLTRASQSLRAQLLGRGTDGVEWSAYLLLFQLVREGPKRSSALAETACVDPSTVSRQVADLVRLGLVERRADPDDGRASLLVATEEGLRTCALLRERRVRAFAHVVAGWPTEDVRLLAGLLGRLNDSFTATRPQVIDVLAGNRSGPRETT